MPALPYQGSQGTTMTHEINTETMTLPVSDGTTLPAYLARPEGDGHIPACLFSRRRSASTPISAMSPSVRPRRLCRPRPRPLPPHRPAVRGIIHRLRHGHAAHRGFDRLRPDRRHSSFLRLADFREWRTGRGRRLHRLLHGRADFVPGRHPSPAPGRSVLLRRRHRPQPPPDFPDLLVRAGDLYAPFCSSGAARTATSAGPSARGRGRPAGGGQALRAGGLFRGRPRLLLRRPRRFNPSPPTTPGR